MPKSSKMPAPLAYKPFVAAAAAPKPKEVKDMTPEEIMALLAPSLELKNWGDMIEDEPISPEEAAAFAAASRTYQAARAAEAKVARLAEAPALCRKNFDDFLLNHIQYNISRSKAVQGVKTIKPVWRVLYANQCDHQASAQELLESRVESMWDWIRALPEYQNQTEEEFEALGMGWESYWEDKYEAYLETVLPGSLHRDAAGEVEICRYFNMPGGCRPKEGGGACPYRHVAGAAPEREECKFFNSPRGCRSGDACPFKHTPAGAAAPSWRSAAAPAAGGGGGEAFAAARAGGGGGGGSRRSSVSTEASDGWQVAAPRFRTATPPAASAGMSRPPPHRLALAAGGGGGGGGARAAEPCKFFESPRGCRSGSSCPYPHV